MNRREALERAGLILGYTVTAPVWTAVMNGCTPPKPGLAFTPTFFNEEQAAIVSTLAEIIIPRTDTPGAMDASIPHFIDQLVGQCFSKEDQTKFLDGLKAFDEEAKKNSGDSFLNLEASKQEEHVKKIHDATVDALKGGEKGEWPFILRMKELTLIGFFTSEIGATQVLQYEAVPGAYHGCVPLKEVGKAWAT